MDGDGLNGLWSDHLQPPMNGRPACRPGFHEDETAIRFIGLERLSDTGNSFPRIRGFDHGAEVTAVPTLLAASPSEHRDGGNAGCGDGRGAFSQTEPPAVRPSDSIVAGARRREREREAAAHAFLALDRHP